MSLLDIRLLNVYEYHRMVEAGIVEGDERVELLAGQIVNKAAKTPPHCAVAKRTTELLQKSLGSLVLLSIHDAVRLDDYSEPEPDIAVLIPDPFYYEDHHPIPS